MLSSKVCKLCRLESFIFVFEVSLLTLFVILCCFISGLGDGIESSSDCKSSDFEKVWSENMNLDLAPQEASL